MATSNKYIIKNFHCISKWQQAYLLECFINKNQWLLFSQSDLSIDPVDEEIRKDEKDFFFNLYLMNGYIFNDINVKYSIEKKIKKILQSYSYNMEGKKKSISNVVFNNYTFEDLYKNRFNRLPDIFLDKVKEIVYLEMRKDIDPYWKIFIKERAVYRNTFDFEMNECSEEVNMSFWYCYKGYQELYKILLFQDDLFISVVLNKDDKFEDYLYFLESYEAEDGSYELLVNERVAGSFITDVLPKIKTINDVNIELIDKNIYSITDSSKSELRKNLIKSSGYKWLQRY